MFYIVLEVQSINGTKSIIPQTYDDLDAAYAKLYTVLAAAAGSEIEFHAGYLLNSAGEMIEGRAFSR